MDKYQIYVYQALIIKSFFNNFKENFLNENDAEKDLSKREIKILENDAKKKKKSFSFYELC